MGFRAAQSHKLNASPKHLVNVALRMLYKLILHF